MRIPLILAIGAAVSFLPSIIYSPYPGDSSLTAFVVSNFSGQDGSGLHWFGQNNPGIDIISQEKVVYSPIEVCPSTGGRIVVVDDNIGQGGHGLVLEQDNIRVEMWHLAGYSDLLLKKVSDGSCVELHDLLGFEGESTTVYPNGVPTLSTFSEQGWDIPAHTHLGIAKTTPWDNGCAERQAGGWYFTNPVCVVQTWDSNTTAVSTNVSFDVISMLQDLFFQPKPREIVPANAITTEGKTKLPKWFWLLAVFAVTGILVMRKGGKR